MDPPTLKLWRGLITPSLLATVNGEGVMKTNKLFLVSLVSLLTAGALFGTQQEKQEKKEQKHLEEITNIMRYCNRYSKEDDEQNRIAILAEFKKFEYEADAFYDLKSFGTGSSVNLLGYYTLVKIAEERNEVQLERTIVFLEEVIKKHAKLNNYCFVHSERSEKMTPLAYAVSETNNSLVRLFLKYGALPEISYEKNGYKFLPMQHIIYWLENLNLWERAGQGVVVMKRIRQRKDSSTDSTPEIDIFDEEFSLKAFSKIYSELSLEDQTRLLESLVLKNIKILETLLFYKASLLPISQNIKRFRKGKTKAALVEVLRKFPQGRPFVCSNEKCLLDETSDVCVDPRFRCGQQKLKPCAACKSVWYCNVECQKADWFAKHGVNNKALCNQLSNQKVKNEFLSAVATLKFQQTLDTMD